MKKNLLNRIFCREEKDLSIYDIRGNIRSVYEFLSKRIKTGQFKQEDCTIFVNRKEMSIRLLFNERDRNAHGSVTGSLVVNQLLSLLGVNTNKLYTIEDLYKILLAECGVAASDSFKQEAKALEKDFYAQVLKKGIDKVAIPDLEFSFSISTEVVFSDDCSREILTDIQPVFVVDNGHLFLKLTSGKQDNDNLREFKKNVIDEQIKSIKAIAPNIVIIEEN